jgi:predicted Zn-dependent protease
MRRLVLILIIVILAGVLFFVEHRDVAARVGLGAVMRLVADFEREAERGPLIVTQISDADESEIGARMVSAYGLSLSSQTPNDKELKQYLEQVGARLASHAQRKGISYHFYLNPSPGFVNAFALPGGHVVVGRGLINSMQSEDELAGVLAHEIVHVDRRHTVQRLQYEVAARKLGLSLPYAIASLPVGMFEAGYNKELELEADRLGAGYAAAEGYSPAASVQLLTRLEALYARKTTGHDAPIKEVDAVVVGAIGEYLRSHPPASERADEIQKEIRVHGWKQQAPRPLAVRAGA